MCFFESWTGCDREGYFGKKRPSRHLLPSLTNSLALLCDSRGYQQSVRVCSPIPKRANKNIYAGVATWSVTSVLIQRCLNPATEKQHSELIFLLHNTRTEAAIGRVTSTLLM